MRPLTIWERIKLSLRMKQTAHIETGLEYSFRGGVYQFTGNVYPVLGGTTTDKYLYDKDGKQFKVLQAPLDI